MFIDVCNPNPCLGVSTCVPVQNDTNINYRCECPDDVKGRNCEIATKSGVTYTLFTEASTWDYARSQCEANGLNLASIHNSDAHEFLLTYTTYVSSFLSFPVT